MHPQAYDFVAHHAATAAEVSVLDIGGRNINGSVRDLFPNATSYVTVDLYAGAGVDHVCDITQWEDDATYDVVVCCEVLEHASNWREIIASAFDRVAAGGVFVMTCAGPGRNPHSGVDGEWRLHEGEHYENVSPRECEREMARYEWSSFSVEQLGRDTRAVGVK